MQLSIYEAKETFVSINGGQINFQSVEELRQLYRKLSRKVHPDLGGSDAEMKKLNCAYEILQKLGCHQAAFESWEERKARMQETEKRRYAIHSWMMEKIVEQVEAAKSSYTMMFQKYFPGVEPSEIDSFVTYNSGRCAVEWKTSCGSVSFKLDVSIYNVDDAGLGNSLENPSFDVSYWTQLYNNGRTYKVSNSRYSWNHSSSELSKPEVVFPAKALSRVAKQTRKPSKMQRRDFIAALANELGAVDQSSRQSTQMMIPISGTQYLGIYRSTIMRVSAWSVFGVFDKNPKGHFVRSSVGKGVWVLIYENDESLKAFRTAIETIREGAEMSEVLKREAAL